MNFAPNRNIPGNSPDLPLDCAFAKSAANKLWSIDQTASE